MKSYLRGFNQIKDYFHRFQNIYTNCPEKYTKRLKFRQSN